MLYAPPPTPSRSPSAPLPSVGLQSPYTTISREGAARRRHHHRHHHHHHRRGQRVKSFNLSQRSPFPNTRTLPPSRRSACITLSSIKATAKVRLPICCSKAISKNMSEFEIFTSRHVRQEYIILYFSIYIYIYTYILTWYNVLFMHICEIDSNDDRSVPSSFLFLVSYSDFASSCEGERVRS